MLTSGDTGPGDGAAAGEAPETSTWWSGVDANGRGKA
jgi:hypothetical protein